MQRSQVDNEGPNQMCPPRANPPLPPWAGSQTSYIFIHRQNRLCQWVPLCFQSGALHASLAPHGKDAIHVIQPRLLQPPLPRALVVCADSLSVPSTYTDLPYCPPDISQPNPLLVPHAESCPPRSPPSQAPRHRSLPLRGSAPPLPRASL